MHSTTNYGMFRTITGNRQVDPNHVARLVQAIEKKNLLSEFPMLVNDKMEVIDGQNRLLAASALNVPIHYQIVKGLDLTHVMDINTASKSWSLLDFVNSYIQLGNPNYVELLAFSKEYGLSISMAGSLLTGRSANSGSITARIKEGKFQINARNMAGRVARMLNELDKYAEFKTKSDRALATSLGVLLQNEDFDPTRLMGKLKTHGLILKRRLNERYYILQLEEMYNFNAKDRVTLYAGQV